MADSFGGSSSNAIGIQARAGGATSATPGSGNCHPLQIVARMARLLAQQNVDTNNRWLVVDPVFCEVLKDEDSSISPILTESIDKKQSPLPQSNNDNIDNAGDQTLYSPSNESKNDLKSQNLSLDEPDPTKRIFGTSAIASRCVIAGVDILRVHEIKQISQVIMMTKSII